jgi:hypothetical protein
MRAACNVEEAEKEGVGNDVVFRSVEQEQALHAALDVQTPLVVALPTSGDKSLLSMMQRAERGQE